VSRVKVPKRTNALSSISFDLVTILQEIGDDLPMAMITTDPHGVITSWNHYAVELYGWPADSVLGQIINEITVGPLNAALAEEILASLAKGDTWFGRFECRRMDGRLIEVGVLDVPIVDAQGQFCGVVGFSQIPELRPSERLRELDALRDFALHLDKAQSSEQERIGAQLHDELSQPIAMATMELLSLSHHGDLPQHLASRLENLASNLQESLGVLQNLCVTLRPDWLNGLSPSDAIDELVRSWSLTTAIRTQILISPQIGEVDEETVMVVMKIIHESLANIERHAEASQVSVRVSISNGWVTTQIVDNGAGFDGMQGFGIRLMKERALSVGGKLSVTGLRSPRSGTSVEFVAPTPPPISNAVTANPSSGIENSASERQGSPTATR